MLAASLLIATTPNKETVIQVRAGSCTAHFAFDLLKHKKVLINADVPHLAINTSLKIVCVSELTSPTKTNSLPGYRSNGLHRVRPH